MGTGVGMDIEPEELAADSPTAAVVEGGEALAAPSPARSSTSPGAGSSGAGALAGAAGLARCACSRPDAPGRARKRPGRRPGRPRS